MAGAEGHAGLDLQRDDARWDLAGIMRAIDEEASGADGREPLLAEADPILIRQRRDLDRMAGDGGEQRRVRRLGIERFHRRVGGEGLFGDQHGLGRGRRELERRADVGGEFFRQGDTGLPQRGMSHRGRYSGGDERGTEPLAIEQRGVKMKMSSAANGADPGDTGAMSKTYYVYILASKRNGTLYIGVTNNLARRVWQHREGLVEGFTKTYGVKMPVYFEMFGGIGLAIAREKRLKRYKREWKINLIEQNNVEWRDLYETLS